MDGSRTIGIGPIVFGLLPSYNTTAFGTFIECIGSIIFDVTFVGAVLTLVVIDGA